MGLYKTGTTTIQDALGATAEQLAAEGVLFPGGSRAQRLAAYDLLGQRVGGEERGEAAGALRRLLDLVDAHDGRAVVVSEEELSLARPRHVRRLVRSLHGHRVIVVGARDPARTVVSAWQQTIVNGGCTSWRDFVASVRGEPGAPPSDGISFHWRHDLLRVVDTWATAVPMEQIRLVTVPPRGASGATLLTRFARAADLPQTWRPPHRTTLRNVSLGAAELEAVRRLNGSLAGRLNATQHRFVIQAGIRARLAGTTSRPLELPAEHQAWARAHGERLAAELEQRRLAVHGDLADLVPVCKAPPERDLDGSSAATARSSWHRRAACQASAEVVGSQLRAGGFWLQKRVLKASDRLPLVAGASRLYVARTSPSRAPRPWDRQRSRLSRPT